MESSEFSLCSWLVTYLNAYSSALSEELMEYTVAS